jgi:hypothetical protein
MPRFAFTLSVDQKDWLESKSAETDLSQGEIVRRVIDTAISDTDSDTDWLSDTASDTQTVSAVSQDEFEELQGRVSKLEANIEKLDTDNQGTSSVETSPTNTSDTPDTADDSTTAEESEKRQSIQEFVTDHTEWTDSRREEVIKTRVTVLQYLRNEATGKDQRVPTRRLFEMCKERDATVTNQTVDPQASNLNQSVFYEKTLKPILDDASDSGLISRLQGGDYGWYWDN